MAKFQFSSKADTLTALQRQLTTGIVPALQTFTVAEWKADSSKIVAVIQKTFSTEHVVVRSSVQGEDSTHTSMAGAFTSITNVVVVDEENIRNAVNTVLASYGDDRPDNQFLVQQQVSNIAMSGVLFTCDLDTLAPYYIINYDDTSGLSTTVTSGTTSTLKTYVRFKRSPHAPKDFRLERIIACAEELQKLTAQSYLDIEFAIDRDEQVYLLQVRPIVTKSKPTPISEEKFSLYLTKLQRKLEKLNGQHPGLFGSDAIYSTMTDWNPAEIIGAKPKRLALSLYKELVTDSIWAYQRHNYGYKNLRSFPLLLSFLGLPYIDVRASFNSFVPGELDDKLSSKLVDYYTQILKKSPTDHDKVEFNIVFSCYFFNLNQKLKKLLNFGFQELELDRIKFALLNLTNSIISPHKGLYRDDLERVTHLDQRYKEVMQSKLSTIDKIYWLVEDCKRYGTLPFAGLARAGFIAVQLLRSLVELEIVSSEEFNLYLNSLNTVAKQLSHDHRALSDGSMSQESFLEKYGHLRPGTYDITSPRYDEAFDVYFKSAANVEGAAEQEKPFEFSSKQKQAIATRLTENGIACNVDELLIFLKEAIEGREYSKFVFTRSLSEVLVLLQQLGTKYGVTRERMAHLDISTILHLYSNLGFEDVPDILNEDIKKNEDSYALTESVKLPQLIVSESSIYDFFLGEVEPNFITLQKVTQFVILEDELLTTDLTNKIIFIRSADPGYDWLFARDIAGLVTMYGGANSHMAIRCAELGIPAVIGCGEVNYHTWGNARALELDCAARQVRIIN